jgi:hypothetical protein
MVTRAQAGGVERDLDVLRTIARERETFLAIPRAGRRAAAGTHWR